VELFGEKHLVSCLKEPVCSTETGPLLSTVSDNDSQPSSSTHDCRIRLLNLPGPPSHPRCCRLQGYRAGIWTNHVARSEVFTPTSNPQPCRKGHRLQAPAGKHSLFGSNSNTHLCFQKTHVIILVLKKELRKAETLKTESKTLVSLTLIYHHISSPISHLLKAPSYAPPLPSPLRYKAKVKW